MNVRNVHAKFTAPLNQPLGNAVISKSFTQLTEAYARLDVIPGAVSEKLRWYNTEKRKTVWIPARKSCFYPTVSNENFPSTGRDARRFHTLLADRNI